MLSDKSVESDRSASSATGAISAFSNQTAADVDYNEKTCNEIVELHNKQARNTDLIKTEVKAMINCRSIQRKDNMTIKGGLKKINELIETIAEDHSLERKKKVDYQQLLVFFQRRSTRHENYYPEGPGTVIAVCRFGVKTGLQTESFSA